MRKIASVLFVLLLVSTLVGVTSAQAPARSSKEGRPVQLSVVPQNGPVVPSVWQTTGPVSLILDDGSAENFIGLNNGTSGSQFLWLNQFTPDPADFPFELDQISVVFGSTSVPLGGAVDLAVYEDTDGGDPSNATWLATYPVTVLANDGVTWSNYTLSAPLALSGPGDVLIAVINRYVVSGVTPPDFPAALDTDASQQRSWVSAWSTDPPSPPVLPGDYLWGRIDDFGFPGNWMIRGSGQTMGGNTMHVNRIAGKWHQGPIHNQLRVLVEAVDQAGMPLQGVAVDASVTLPDNTVVPYTKTTLANGSAGFKIAADQMGWYEFCVTNLTKDGYTYVPGDNMKTCRRFLRQ